VSTRETSFQPHWPAARQCRPSCRPTPGSRTVGGRSPHRSVLCLLVGRRPAHSAITPLGRESRREPCVTLRKSGDRVRLAHGPSEGPVEGQGQCSARPCPTTKACSGPQPGGAQGLLAIGMSPAREAFRYNTVTTNALSTRSRSSSIRDGMCVSAALGKDGQDTRKVEGLVVRLDLGVRISLGALESPANAGFSTVCRPVPSSPVGTWEHVAENMGTRVGTFHFRGGAVSVHPDRGAWVVRWRESRPPVPGRRPHRHRTAPGRPVSARHPLGGARNGRNRRPAERALPERAPRRRGDGSTRAG
jgi:hypothetical protein